MFAPQFSLRLLLGVLTGCAFISLVFSFGAQGRAWALGASVAIVSLGVILLVHAFVFWLTWLFASAADRWQGSRSRSDARLND